ncbi:hypothetical protein A1F94_001388 [Pyrenophora tritici-repentis]|nr:hypothetical protein A1F94_001388 [Pyrenophora tritici-repentis]KAI1522606.1 hypothetical protein PtrSN001C_011776 [Pyrenophora tritici-repentis]KAI1560628.1 hypothetical protein PtrEW4_011071 [Pyrenophora tritici-repentis]KAI1570714.1 hypothetical protein PtrEW13061_011464 [Pyrenophora tritici-repentis]KAI1591601.1 hypothetical protein PtrCC142_011756 [Pyrenophora tritici-repentis]
MASSSKRKATDILDILATKKVKTTESNDSELMDGDSQIQYINKWRTSVFLQRGFPPLVEKLSWAPTEKAYLELFLERVTLEAKKDTSIVVPDNNKILEAFNEYFDGRSDLRDAKGHELPARPARTVQPFKSYLNRPDTRVRTPRDGLNSYKTSNGNDAYMPKITDDDIAAFIDSGILNAGSAKNIDLQASMEQTTLGEITVDPENPKIAQQTTLLVLDKNTAQSTALNVNSEVLSALSIAPQGALEMPVTTDVNDKGAAEVNSSIVSLDEAAPQVLHKATQPQQLKKTGTARRAPKWKSLPDTPVVSTPPEVVARLKAEGWVGPPDLPKSDAEALQKHRELKNKQPLNTSYIVQAEEDLDDKLKPYPLPVGSYYTRNGSKGKWVSDRKEDTKPSEGHKGTNAADLDDGEFQIDYPRHRGAAGVAGVLGAAIIPPYGYGGPISDLVKRRLLPNEELVLHDSGQFMRNKLNEEHDRRFDKRIQNMADGTAPNEGVGVEGAQKQAP